LIINTSVLTNPIPNLSWYTDRNIESSVEYNYILPDYDGMCTSLAVIEEY